MRNFLHLSLISKLGLKVLIQCQAQINIHPWDGDTQPEFTKYLVLIKKDASFLIERERAFAWSQVTTFPHHVSPRGSDQGKIQITLNKSTFCARDMGIAFNPQSHSYSVSR
jgi:hypothetical protein